MADPPPPWRGRFRLWRRYWLRDPALAALYYPLLHLLRLLPTEHVSGIGATLGKLNGRRRYGAVRERAKRGYVHLTGAEMSQAELDAMVDRLFANAGRAVSELAVLDRLWPEGRIEVTGLEHLYEARRAGQPMIGACLHIGNWDALGIVLAALGFDFKSFYNVPKNRFEERLIVHARERYGAKLLYPGVGATRAALRLLIEERGILGIYVDEDRRGLVQGPLFGREPIPRSNLVVAVRLAMASGAALIPSYIERLEGARFRTVFLAPVELVEAGADRQAALRENVMRLDRAISEPVLAHLDQWFMLFDYYRPERF